MGDGGYGGGKKLRVIHVTRGNVKNRPRPLTGTGNCTCRRILGGVGRTPS